MALTGVGHLKHKHPMPITVYELHDCVHEAGIPTVHRTAVIAIVTQGLLGYRAYKIRSYYSPKGTVIKKPTAVHHPPLGRHDQSGARTLLISALCRAWMEGFGQAPTLNNKKDPDSPFCSFATRVMKLEGIGKAHHHLESYWTERKLAWLKNNQP